MHPERLIIDINVVYKYISDNFYFDYKTLQVNLTELFKKIVTNELKMMIFSSIGICHTFRCSTIPNCKIEVLRKQKKINRPNIQACSYHPTPFCHRPNMRMVDSLSIQNKKGLGRNSQNYIYCCKSINICNISNLAARVCCKILRKKHFVRPCERFCMALDQMLVSKEIYF